MRVLSAVLLVLTAACGRSGGASGADDTLRRIGERGAIVVGIELGFEPFEGVDEEGDYVGFDIDLARAFARDLEVKCRFEPMEWTALQTALGQGQIDVIWSGMTATVSRSRSILFSDTYFRTRLDVLVRKESGFGKADDLESAKIAVKTGTTGESMAETRFPNATLVRFEDESLCAQEVVNGRADAFLYDRFSIARHHEANPGTTRVVPDAGFEPYAVAMRPGNLALMRALNLFLERARWDGRYARIHRKHFGVPPDDR